MRAKAFGLFLVFFCPVSAEALRRVSALLSDGLAEAGLDPGEAPASSSVIVPAAQTISTWGQRVSLLL